MSRILLSNYARTNYVKEGKDEEKSEGFWQELFLLRPNTTELHRLLTGLRADDVLQLQVRTFQALNKMLAN